MIRRLILPVLASALLAGLPLRAADPEPDARRPHPMAAVGVVLKDGTAVCTGSLIAPDLVVTAAHCAEGSGPGADPARVRFRTGAYPGVAAMEVPAARIVRHPLYPQAGEKAGVERRAGYDLALLRLAAAIPGTVATPLARGENDVSLPRLLVASYRGGEGVRARERTCPVIAATDRMIEMGCDVRPGESGAPVLQRAPEGLVLVGVLSARAEDGPQKLAIAAGAARIGQLLALMGPDLPAP